jgi:dTDP-4-dehydrorhamnose reductase
VTALIFGETGQVGWELQRALNLVSPVIGLGRRDVDLADEAKIREVIRRLRPRIIVNAAAFTAVDDAELEATLAHRINAEAPGILAEEAARLDAWLIHYSTDYVFDGKKTGPYTETDAPAPLSVYGASKLAGETAITSVNGKHLIFRCSWLYSNRRTNFLLSILSLALKRESIKVIDDCIGAPTSVALVADVTGAIVRKLYEGEHAHASGIYHLAAGGMTTWHEYASFLVHEVNRLGMATRLDPSGIGRISEEAHGAPARRPLNSCFDTRKLRETFGVELSDWKIGVGRLLEEMIAPMRMMSLLDRPVRRTSANERDS